MSNRITPPVTESRDEIAELLDELTGDDMARPGPMSVHEYFAWMKGRVASGAQRRAQARAHTVCVVSPSAATCAARTTPVRGSVRTVWEPVDETHQMINQSWRWDWAPFYVCVRSRDQNYLAWTDLEDGSTYMAVAGQLTDSPRLVQKGDADRHNALAKLERDVWYHETVETIGVSEPTPPKGEDEVWDVDHTIRDWAAPADPLDEVRRVRAAMGDRAGQILEWAVGRQGSPEEAVQAELSRLVELLGADARIVAGIAAYRQTMSPDELLTMLREYNEGVTRVNAQTAAESAALAQQLDQDEAKLLATGRPKNRPAMAATTIPTGGA